MVKIEVVGRLVEGFLLLEKYHQAPQHLYISHTKDDGAQIVITAKVPLYGDIKVEPSQLCSFFSS